MTQWKPVIHENTLAQSLRLTQHKPNPIDLVHPSNRNLLEVQPQLQNIFIEQAYLTYLGDYQMFWSLVRPVKHQTTGHWQQLWHTVSTGGAARSTALINN